MRDLRGSAARYLVCAVGLAALLAVAAPAVRAQSDDWPRRVLITNDDGIDDPKILALARAFAPVAETYVVAPTTNRSASGAYLAALVTGSVTVEPRPISDDFEAYAVDGYPADCVVWGVLALLKENPPDVVISGPNSGPNLAEAWVLSGTIGAARLAALLGVPAIAVSGLEDDIPGAVDAVTRWVVQLAGSPMVHDLETGQYLTVSLPRVAPDEIQGVDVVSRVTRHPLARVQRSDEAEGGAQVWEFEYVGGEGAVPDGSDLASHAANRIAIVPMQLDENDYALLERLRANASEIPGWPAPAPR